MHHFRTRKAGTVVWMGSKASSKAGWYGLGTGGPYCGSKFALQGIAESFQAEVAHLDIKSLFVEPGYFRTSLLSPSNYHLVPTQFEEYKGMTESVYGMIEAFNGNQQGDLEKGVKMTVDVVRQERIAEGREIPMRLMLGSDAVKNVRRICEETLEELKKWEDVSVSTDF